MPVVDLKHPNLDVQANQKPCRKRTMIKLWLRFVEEEGITLDKPPQVNSLVTIVKQSLSSVWFKGKCASERTFSSPLQENNFESFLERWRKNGKASVTAPRWTLRMMIGSLYPDLGGWAANKRGRWHLSSSSKASWKIDNADIPDLRPLLEPHIKTESRYARFNTKLDNVFKHFSAPAIVSAGKVG